MSVTQLGQINTTALIVPDVYVQIVPPSVYLLNGLPTNILGVVGTATWGPTNQPVIIGNMAMYSAQFGAIQARKYDMGTAVAAAVLQGAMNFRCVRVTDGTDTSASIVKDTNGITLTSKYTGTLGNSIQAIFGAGSMANTQKVTITLPGMIPEVFDNISQGVASLTPTAGTGYTSVPGLVVSAPQATGGLQALATASLVVVGTPSVSAGGSGQQVGDHLTFPNGVVLLVETLNAGAVATVSVVSAGSIAGGAIPNNPVAQTASDHSGIGCTITFAWGLGPATVTQNGSGYTSATVTLSDTTHGGSYAAVVSYWGNITTAINNGIGNRGPSQLVVGTVGASTSAPQAATVSLVGGTDGAGAISASTLLGVDTIPRKGMYALRGTFTSIAMLTDCDDSTSWATQNSFGLSEGIYMMLVGPAGDTISNAVSVKASAGIDSYACKLLFGDWILFLDTVNNQTRLISPQGFIGGLLSNMSPEGSSLNKTLYGIVGTQKSSVSGVYSGAELQTLGQAGIDIITNPVPGGNYFGDRFGRNTSSNAVIHGDNYTRMTNYIAYTLSAGMGYYVGKVQSLEVQQQATATIESFLYNMWVQKMIGNSLGSIPYSVEIDGANNPQSRVALGYLQADVKVTYLSIIEYFIINLEAGQSVQITRTNVQQNG